MRHVAHCLAAVLGIVLTFALGGQAMAAETVTYLLPAPTFLPAFGPWMLAKQRGYYAAEGLNVEFETGKGGADVAKQVGVGNAVIGGAMGDTPIIVRANGVPVKAVAVLGGGGLTRNDVNIEAAGATNVWKLFLAHQADAMASVPDWIVDVDNGGAVVRIIPSDDYFPSMAQAVVASDTVIKEQPALIRRLVDATLHGMRDIMADPQSAARDYVKAVPAHAGQEGKIAEVFALYNKYVYRGQSRLGAMDAKRLAALQNFYVKQGIVEKATPVADLFTNEFVK